jgi:hypothetical protein
VSTVMPFRRTDVTGAMRARRYRQRKNGNETKASVTVDAHGITVITTVAMCALAARLGDERATAADLQIAERLIMALVDRQPPDSVFDIGADCRGGTAFFTRPQQLS